MADSTPNTIPDHMGFQFLKEFVVRLISIDCDAAISSGDKERDDIELVRKTLLDHSTAWSKVARRLDEHIGRSVEKAYEAARDIDSHPIEHLQHILSKIKNRASEIDCNKCSPRPCSGTIEDSQNIHFYGSCIKSLKSEFSKILSIARWIVNHFAARHSDHEITLSTQGEDEGSARPFSVPFSVAGQHRSKDTYNTPISEVRLNFWVREFDFESYHAITYVAMHELLCHAWDGIHLSPRRHPDDADGYGDGWMDVVAVLVLDCWCDRRWQSVGCPPAPDHAELKKTIGRSYHKARTRPTQERGQASQRYQGADSARNFLSALEDYFSHNHEIAVEQMIKWSLYLSINRPRNRERVIYWELVDKNSLIRLISQEDYESAFSFIDDRCELLKNS